MKKSLIRDKYRNWKKFNGNSNFKFIDFFKQYFFVVKCNLLNKSVLNAHPILPIVVLGASVIGSAGFGWSGEIDLLGGGDIDCIEFFGIPEPNPVQIDRKHTINIIK